MSHNPSHKGVAPGDDEKVRVTPNDLAPSYLLNKITGSGAAVVSEVNDGDAETLNIHVDPSPSSNPDPNLFWRWLATREQKDLKINVKGGAQWPISEQAGHGDIFEGVVYGYQFDDKKAKGIGGLIYVPSGVTDITMLFRHKAETDPGAARVVSLDMYWRRLPEDGLADPWTAANSWDGVVSMGDGNWHYQGATKTLASQSMIGGSLWAFEIVRDPNNDDLTGDWQLASLEIQFS
jgi:hypothetical protein